MKNFILYLLVAMVSFGTMFFSGGNPAIAEPTVSFIDGSDTWYAGFVSSCPEGCNYVSDTNDPLGPWSGQSVHFKGLNVGGDELVYLYKLEFDQDVEISSVVISGAAWDSLSLLDNSMNLLKQFGLPGGNELHTYRIHTYGPVDKIFYIEESDNVYTYFRYRSNISVNFSQPCAAKAEIILNGKDYSAKSDLWTMEGDAILTWWDPTSSGGTDIWVEYEANLTKGKWNIGLCAINHSHLGHDGLGADPDWYPEFHISNSLTDDIIIVPASDTSLNSGHFSFEAPTDDLYTVRLRWINDKAEGTRPDGAPVLDANIKIVRVYFASDKDFIPLYADIDPDTLNIKSKGNYITCYIELPKPYELTSIDPTTITLIIGENVIQAEDAPLQIGDYDNDGIADLKVKFDRESVQDACSEIGLTEMILNLVTNEGVTFQGSDGVMVINEGKEHFSDNQESIVY